jgi:hypothetical protein
MGWVFPHGVGLAQMVLAWLVGLLILYPLCSWWGRFKHGRPTGSVWRLL